MALSDYADPREVLRITRAAIEKAGDQRERIEGFWKDIHALTDLVTAWATREYTVVPWRTIATAVGALLYFLNPVDAIADVIPGLGFVDDGAVLAFVVSSLHGDLEEFQRWRAARKQGAAKTQRRSAAP